MDLAPQFASLGYGVSNTLATLPGMISPSITGLIVQNKEAAEWQIVFYIAAAVYIAGNTFFLIFGRGEEQSWNKIDPFLGDPTRVTSEVDGVRRVVGEHHCCPFQ